MSIYPFKVDTCGSYLRSVELLDGRYKESKGEITKAQLTELENAEIRKLVEKQVAHGLKVVTDGELRRNDFSSDFCACFNGIGRNAPILEISSGTSYKDLNTGKALGSFNSWRFNTIIGKIIANPNHPELAGFDYLKSITPAGITPKILIPSPVFFFANIKPTDKVPEPYKTLDEAIIDAGNAYKETLLEFYKHGCKYIQIDEPCIFVIATLFGGPDPKNQWDHHKYLVDLSDKLFSIILQDLPSDLHILYHACRGNNREFAKEKIVPPYGYKDIVEHIGCINPEASLLEYDDDRSGGFEPLQKIHELRPSQSLLLGVVTTKEGDVESDELIEQRIREAAKYVPLENLGICNQCGFGTLKEGNPLTVEQQWAKVDALVRVGKKVWGSA